MQDDLTRLLDLPPEEDDDVNASSKRSRLVEAEFSKTLEEGP